MPIIDMPVDLLLARIAKPARRSAGGSPAAAAGAPLRLPDLVELLPRLGCELEEVAETQQFLCQRCSKIYDRTEAQGAPLVCTQCGADFRAAPDALSDLGRGQVLRLNMLAVRPDIFDPGGMARYIRGYLGIETGLVEYPLDAAQLRVQVDPQLAQDASYRPFIACAVVRNVRLDHGTIKIVMNLQEDLHWALGRNRKLASIGVYDLDTLRGEVFHYDAVDPDGLRFVPLGLDPRDPAAALTPREILARHKTGQAFAHLLAPLARYPLLRDGAGTVLSMPPIINSECTRVTLKTRAFFIDVTGLAQRTVQRALNIVVTSLQELLPGIAVEAVVIEGGGAPPAESAGKPGNGQPRGRKDQAGHASRVPGHAAAGAGEQAVAITPDLAPAEIILDVRQAAETIGIDLNAGQLAELLESMGYGVEEGPRRAAPPGGDASRGGENLRVLVPAYRNDVMHPVDLVEDAAIAYGYDRLPTRLVPTFTVGVPRPIEEQSVIARRILTGLGLHQVMTLVLTSGPAAFGKWRVPADLRAVLIENPISVEQTMCRVSLLPGLLETLAINKQYELPQELFEVGDVCFVDTAAETGAREERQAAVALIGTHVGYADIRAVADAVVHELGAEYRVSPTEHASFIPGRVAALHTKAGDALGVMGEIHPEVIEAYGLKHPVAVLELSLGRLTAAGAGPSATTS